MFDNSAIAGLYGQGRYHFLAGLARQVREGNAHQSDFRLSGLVMARLDSLLDHVGQSWYLPRGATFRVVRQTAPQGDERAEETLTTVGPLRARRQLRVTQLALLVSICTRKGELYNDQDLGSRTR